MIASIIRSLQTTAAGVWLGGMILIAIVAQTTFTHMRTLDSKVVSKPDVASGAVMARNFQRFDAVQCTCVILLAVGQIARMAMGARQWSEFVRLVLIGVAAAVLIYATGVVTPKILELQSLINAPDAEAETRRVFDAIHATSVRISKINLMVVLAIALSLAWPRKPVTPSPAATKSAAQATGGAA